MLMYMLFLLTVNLTVYSQQVRLRVTDARTGKAVAFAHIVFESNSSGLRTGLMTDMHGEVPNITNDKSTIWVTYIGYHMYKDSLLPGEAKGIRLEPEIYNMDEVVITGQYTPRRVDKSIYPVRVITARDIDKKGSNNLNELLTSELNIRTRHDGALGSKILLQGLGGEHIKFLIDGVPVVGRMDGNIDLGQLNLHNVQHIEVIEGPMSVVYGSNALAGVINIITNDNKHTKYTTNANAYYESVGSYNFSADASVRKGRWSGSVAGARNFFEGFSLVENTRSKRWKPKRQYNADIGLNYSHDENRIRFNTSYFNELLLDRGNLLPPYYETAFDNYFYTNRLSSKLDASTKLFTNRHLNVLASYSYYDRVKNAYIKDLTTLQETLRSNPDDQDTSSFNQYMLRLSFSKSDDKQWFNYQMGFDLSHEDGFGKRILDGKQAIGDYAAFVSLKLTPLAALTLQPGIRYSYNTKYNAPLVYSINLKYNFSDAMRIRASYAKGFRAPSLKELYLEFVDINHNIRGNTDLKAENSHNVRLSLHYHQEKLTYDWGMELGMFYNNIYNNIHLATMGTENDLYTYLNLDNMITQGFQLNFNNRIYPWLQLKLGISHTGRKQIAHAAMDHDFVYSTDIITQLNYTWQKPDLFFSMYYKYNGPYPEVFIGQDEVVSRITLDGYHLLDVSVGRRFLSNRLNLRIGAKNLLDNTNIHIKGDTGSGGIHSGAADSSPVGWGRTFFVKLGMSLKKY